MTFIPDREDRLWRETEQEQGFRIPTPLWYALSAIFLVALVIGLWHFFAPTQKNFDKRELPLIRADETAYKIKAEDQGIPSVKHQDKLVYGRIRGDQNSPTVEHILPDPEPPLAQLQEAPETLKMVEQYQPNDLEIEKLSEEPPSTSLTSIEDLIEEGLPLKKQEPEQKPLAKKAAKGTIFIQLGSLKSHDLAESEWERLSKKHKDIFGDLKPTIQKVDLGMEEGIYHRLRTGPYETHEEATAVCEKLKERKVECLVIR